VADLLISIGRKKDKKAEPRPELGVEVPEGTIAVTEAAADEIKRKLAEDGKPEGVFRVGIQGGGCSGLQYLFAVEDEARAKDSVIEAHGVRVVVDPKSLKLLGGTLLDFEKALGGGSFKMRNPHVKSSCSCGSSFTVR
jgi:iron-sulfur cluster assembly accessory protein